MSSTKSPPATQQPAQKQAGSAVGRRRQKSDSQAERVVAPNAARLIPPVGAAAASPRLALFTGAIVLAAGIWAYLPTLVALVQTWNREPDYSHGFLVVPAALLFLWLRRSACPGVGSPSVVLGLSLLGVAVAMRCCAALFYFEFLDGWSLLPWVAATVAITGGRRLLWWCLPAIGFLWFMVPLPFGIETMLSMPLQKIATKLSCYALQLLGQPAFAEGNVILLGSHQLEVAQACSGLRLFMSVSALAYAYVALVRRGWLEKAILIASLVPIAISANALRIVATGLMYQFTSSDTAHYFAHELAGLAMIPLAAAMFGGVLWYLRLLVREDEVMEMSVLVRESRV